MISNGEMASKPSLEILMQQLLIFVAFDIAAPTLGIWLGPRFIEQLLGPNFTQLTTLWTLYMSILPFLYVDFLLTTKVPT